MSAEWVGICSTPNCQEVFVCRTILKMTKSEDFIPRGDVSKGGRNRSYSDSKTQPEIQPLQTQCLLH